MALWSELPGDLLRAVHGHIGRYFDKIRFTCVCTHWQSELPNLSKLPDLPLRQPQPPWLLLPYKTGSMCGLYDPLENNRSDIDLPEAGDKVFKGTGHGWVVTEQLDGSIDVLNPLTRVRVPLPPRYTFPNVIKYDPENIGEEYIFEGTPNAVSSMDVRDSAWYLEKVVLSSSPLSEDFIAVAVFATKRLAYCKVSDKEWRDLVAFDEDLDDNTTRRRYHDVTFLGGKLYAVSYPAITLMIGEYGNAYPATELMICDDFRSCPRLRKCDSLQVAAFRGPLGGVKLTTSTDSLVMVRRRERTKYCNAGFEMHRLDVNPDTTTGWTRLKSLDDDEILFTGLGTQILFTSQDFIGNRIYFASDNLKPDCGVFDFEDGSFKPLDYLCIPSIIWPSPIWFEPNPY